MQQNTCICNEALFIKFYIQIFSHVNTQVEMIRSKLEIYLDMVEKSETNNEEFEKFRGG